MQLNIYIDNADDERVQEAFGNNLGLGHPASEQEIEDGLLKYIADTTRMYEQMMHNQSFSPPPFETQPPQR